MIRKIERTEVRSIGRLQFKQGLRGLASKDLKEVRELATWMSSERHSRQKERPVCRPSDGSLSRVRKS